MVKKIGTMAFHGMESIVGSLMRQNSVRPLIEKPFTQMMSLPI